MTTGILERMLGGLPPYEANEPLVRRAYGAFANELERAAAIAQAIRDGLSPSSATDTYKGLSMLEAQLGIAVAPAGTTDDQRRANVLAWIAARDGGTGEGWVELMSLAFGGSPWTYFEGPDDLEVTVIIPLEEGSLSAEQALQFARAVTPAHLDIIPTYGTGFLVGVSDIGVEPL